MFCSMLFREGRGGGTHSCSLPLLLRRRVGVEKADVAMVVGCLIGEDSDRELMLLDLYYALARPARCQQCYVFNKGIWYTGGLFLGVYYNLTFHCNQYSMTEDGELL